MSFSWYAKYSQYLKSKHWKMLKASKAKICPKECSSCGSHKSVQLHHMLYRRKFTDTRLEDTAWLCMECHQALHAVKMALPRTLGATLDLLSKFTDRPTSKPKQRRAAERAMRNMDREFTERLGRD